MFLNLTYVIDVDDVSTDSDECVIHVSVIEVRNFLYIAYVHLHHTYSCRWHINCIVTSMNMSSCFHFSFLKSVKREVSVLVYQMSGSHGYTKDALGEIASRYRARCFRDATFGAAPASVGSGAIFSSRGNLPVERPSPSGVARGGRSGGYESFKVS